MAFVSEQLEILSRFRPNQCLRWIEPKKRVLTFCAVDHGGEPAIGEVRLSETEDESEALEQACRLARGTTVRAGLLGLRNAGVAMVVVRNAERDHDTTLAMLRERMPTVPSGVLASFGMLEDVSALESLIVPEAEAMLALRGRVLDACVAPLFEGPGAAPLRHALVLGANPWGRDLATHLRTRQIEVSLWDEDSDRAEQVAAEAGATVHRGPWLEAAVDLLVPCLSHPVIDEAAAAAVQASVIAGAVPQVFASPAVRTELEQRGRRFVPELLAATAETIAVADALELLKPDAAVELLARTAHDVLGEPEGAHDRAISIAIERSRQAASAVQDEV